MRIQPSLLLASMLVGTLGIRVVQAAPQPKKPTFTIQISMPQTVIESGAPATVNATLTNASDHDIFEAIGIPHRAINIKVFSGNKPVPETPYGLKAHGKDSRPFVGSVFRAAIKPGSVIKVEADLSKEYNLSKPGKYTVQAERWDDNTHQMVESNTITITVTK